MSPGSPTAVRRNSVGGNPVNPHPATSTTTQRTRTATQPKSTTTQQTTTQQTTTQQTTSSSSSSSSQGATVWGFPGSSAPSSSTSSSSSSSSTSSSSSNTIYISGFFVEGQDGEMTFLSGQNINPDQWTTNELSSLLMHLQPGFNRGSYQALAAEVAKRLTAEGRADLAKVVSELAALTPASLTPEEAQQQGITPFDSSRGVLGSMDQAKQFYAGREAGRAGSRRILIGPSDDGRFQLDDGSSPQGSYAYVTLLNGVTMMWPTKADGSDTFHGGLSYFASHVAFAGVVTFDKDGNVVEWNADSGTYKPDPNRTGQAPFPQDKFRRGKGY